MTGGHDYWVEDDGWPTDCPKNVVRALWEIPGAMGVSEDRIRTFARQLARASTQGRLEEMPSRRKSTRKAADAEIVKFHDLCEKLAEHIETMHRPAVDALLAEGVNALYFAQTLKDAQEIARLAYGASEGSAGKAGRPKKAEATAVTELCAGIFEEVSGIRPTFTTDPVTEAVSGDWPRVLRLVFEALFISASVESQVRGQMEKSTKI